MLVDEVGEVGDHLAVTSEKQFEIVAQLEGDQPELLEPRRLTHGEVLGHEVAERSAPPQTERGGELLRAGLDGTEVVAVELCRLSDRAFEAVGVDQVPVDLERVAARSSDHELRRGVGGEPLAQVRDLGLQGVRRILRLVVAPQDFGERRGGDDLAPPQQQHREDPLRGPRPNLDERVARANLEWTEHTEFHERDIIGAAVAALLPGSESEQSGDRALWFSRRRNLEEGNTVVHQISRDELRRRIAADPGSIVLVEALGADYFADAHIPGAINLPPDHVDALAPRLLPDLDAAVVVYCSGSCESSEITADRLAALGYTDVSVYDGGKEDWVEHGLPVERSNLSE